MDVAKKSTKSAGICEQKSEFLKNFNSFDNNNLILLILSKITQNSAKSTGSSNYRGTFFCESQRDSAEAASTLSRRRIAKAGIVNSGELIMATGFLLITITHLPIYPFTHPFMQNKANLLNTQMNVNKVLTKDYENVRLHRRGKNKPNSNPIQTQSNPIKPNSPSAIRNTQYAIRNTNPNKANFKRRARPVTQPRGGLVGQSPDPNEPLPRASDAARGVCRWSSLLAMSFICRSRVNR